MGKHKVRTHRWNNGILETLDHWFDSLEESMLFAGNTAAHAVKVYDDTGQLRDSRQSSEVPDQIRTATATNSYA